MVVVTYTRLNRLYATYRQIRDSVFLFGINQFIAGIAGLYGGYI